jgi:hypothetical protein
MKVKKEIEIFYDKGWTGRTDGGGDKILEA